MKLIHHINEGERYSPRRGLFIEYADGGFEGVSLVLWVAFGEEREFRADYDRVTIADTPCFWARLSWRRGSGFSFRRGVDALHYSVLGDA